MRIKKTPKRQFSGKNKTQCKCYRPHKHWELSFFRTSDLRVISALPSGQKCWTTGNKTGTPRIMQVLPVLQTISPSIPLHLILNPFCSKIEPIIVYSWSLNLSYHLSFKHPMSDGIIQSLYSSKRSLKALTNESHSPDSLHRYRMQHNTPNKLVYSGETRRITAPSQSILHLLPFNSMGS